MTSGIERIGNYVMSVLDEAALRASCVADIHFSALDLMDAAANAACASQKIELVSGAGLAGLHPKTLLCESQLAEVLDHDPRTIRSMVSRQELPAPVDFGNKKVWFAGRILDFLEARMERAEQSAQRRYDSRSKLLGGLG